MFYLGIIALALIIGVITVSAQGPAGSGWWTGFTIQNIDDDTDPAINVIAEAYLKQGQTDPATKPKSVVELPQDVSVTFNPGLAGSCGAVATPGCRIAFSTGFSIGFRGISCAFHPMVQLWQLSRLTTIHRVVLASMVVLARGGYQGTGAEVADYNFDFPDCQEQLFWADHSLIRSGCWWFCASEH